MQDHKNQQKSQNSPGFKVKSQAFNLAKESGVGSQPRAQTGVTFLPDQSPSELWEKSKIHHLQNNNQLAIEQISRSIELQETADKHCFLASLHNQLKEHNKAIDSYSRAFKIKDMSVYPQTLRFLQNSIVIKRLPQMQKLVTANLDAASQSLTGEAKDVKEVNDITVAASKQIGNFLKYEDYDEETNKAKEENFQQLKDLISVLTTRLERQQQEYFKLKGEINNLYKNHEKVFMQGLETSTLSEDNKKVLKVYFTTFCQKMELFYLTLRVLQKVPDSGLSFRQIAVNLDSKESMLIQLEKKLSKYMGYIEKAKGVLQELPYVSLIFGFFHTVDKYLISRIKVVHEQHQIKTIHSTWMNCQVFNDFVADLASRLVETTRLRIIKHDQPNFIAYLEVIWARVKKVFMFKSNPKKLEELNYKHYSRQQYVQKLAERDAALVFYAFQVERLKRVPDMDQMTKAVITLLEEFELIKIDQHQFATAATSGKSADRRCLLF